ncbi:MAG: 16S rRNA (cytidine(1402)-2'-O)-methyltransferase [Chloroflexota bacterium]|nr:16S rRNA (cytidine(1402)-2'-O)-methyltransferase [Chloroflexota bacterium]MDE2894522.1 16S rRNA (cytidine(1402)-2'-O)-methyltransferase [Chloroflexota bacterium]
MSTDPGTLYVVATPIGNLEDITLRALRVLREVDLIAAEHVPVALALLRHYEIDTPVLPYHDRGPDPQRIVERIERGQSVALVSDAGTPGVSDPGRNLVAAALDAGFDVVPIPGAAASVALWSVSGAESPQVMLYGFLPRKTSERRRALEQLAALGQPSIVFESPRRVRSTFQDMADTVPDAQLVVGRELTKLHEQIWRGTPAEALEEFGEPRGEFTILLIPPVEGGRLWTDDDVAKALAEAASQGASRPQAARFVAQQSGRPRREVYALWPFESER